MKIKITRSFQEKLRNQIEFIAKDKPSIARKFKIELLERIHDVPIMPYKNRKSIFFDREDILDLVYKGYIIVYRINPNENSIEIFGFIKYQDNLFKE
jgi:plasmid stabilization system protein ParE